RTWRTRWSPTPGSATASATSSSPSIRTAGRCRWPPSSTRRAWSTSSTCSTRRVRSTRRRTSSSRASGRFQRIWLRYTRRWAAAAAADEDPADAVDRRGLGHQFGRVLAVVVDGEDRHAHVVAEVEELGERLQRGHVGVDVELPVAVLVRQRDLPDEADDQRRA